MNLKPTIKQLQQERRHFAAKLARLDEAIRLLSRGPRAGRILSPNARKRIAAAQRKRWAKWQRARRAKEFGANVATILQGRRKRAA